MTVVEAEAFVLEDELAALEPGERSAAASFLRENPPGAGAPLAIVIPAYNEEPTVAEVIREVPREARGLAAEIIVVVDGAKDRTAAEATSAGALVCDVPVNRGQGAALRLGYWLARARGAEIIVTIDADGQYEGVRHLGVIVFAGIITVLIRHRITDPACGLRAMRAEVTAAVKLEQPQYQASELMISAALHGYRIAEVPTTMRDRDDHATRTKKGSNFSYGVRFARAAIHTWRRDRKAARTRLRPAKTQRS
jgi:glycosyltransferase involved in cell wall biosynthesis